MSEEVTSEGTERLLDAIFGKKPGPKPTPTPPLELTKAHIRKLGEAAKEAGLSVEEAAEQLKGQDPRKVKFVPKPHLTARPFQANEGLRALQKQLHEAEPQRGQSRKNKEKK